jgi:transcriptional regulator with XRE-family HTH domain
MSKLEKGASYPGLEIIAKLAAVLEVEPAELPALPGGPGQRRCRIGARAMHREG